MDRGIHLQEVEVILSQKSILKNLNLHLIEDRIGVIGLNGSGKSTFARLLNGLQLPTKGVVKAGNLDTRKEGKSVRQQVGFVFQNPDNQIVYPIVEEDLAFGLKNYGIPSSEIKMRVEEILKKYELSHLRGKLTHELSGGEKQMIALLGVLVMNPKHIILDEPTTLLDLKRKKQFMKAIESTEQQIVMVTHHLELLENFDRVICFHEGQVFADGDPQIAIQAYKELCQDAQLIH